MADLKTVKFEINCRGQAETYSVPVDTLQQHFAGFNTALKTGGDSEPIKVNFNALAAFKTIHHWLWTGEFMLENYDVVIAAFKSQDRTRNPRSEGLKRHHCNKTLFGSCGHAESRTDHHHPSEQRLSGIREVVFEIYRFAQRHDSRTLRRIATLTWQRLDLTSNNTVLSTRAGFLFTELGGASCPLGLWLAAEAATLAGGCGKQMRCTYKGLSLHFMVEVAMALRRGVVNDRDIIPALQTWCDYHEHENEAERRACEASRPNDWDMCRKRGVEWNG
jgi:hypothetical protein